MTADASAAQSVEQVARTSFGRLVAYLAARWGDVAAAEDALADALHTALERWPRDGVPRNPEGWLMTVARNRLRDGHRHRALALASENVVREALFDPAIAEEVAVPDERLKLLFVCAHPAIDPAVHTPLMLQVVLGLDVPRIASALLVSPQALMKRLTRAKIKIREAGIRFEEPPSSDWAARLPPVLDAIYGAYALGWSDPLGLDAARQGLAEEAIWLARVAHKLLPREPELAGLLAGLMLGHARRAARRVQGRFVPLTAQDLAAWDTLMIEEAEALLRIAGEQRSPGPYQLEAAIQAVHVARRLTGDTDWSAIRLLYEGLLAMAPTTGARVAAAIALGECGEWRAALAELDALQSPTLQNFQPYWAGRAHVLSRLDQRGPAAEAYRQAAALAEDPAVRLHLLEAAKALMQ